MSADLVARALAVRVRRSAQKSANTLALIAAVRRNGYCVRPNGSLASGDTPTLTVGANGANSTINSAAPRSAMVPRTDARLTYLSGVPMLAGPTYPREVYFTSRGAYYGSADAEGTPLRATGYFAYEFVHTGSVFEIPVYGAMGGGGVNLRVLVNGAIAGTTSVPNALGGLYFVRVAFTEARSRTVRIETWGIPCNGVHVANGNEVTSTGRSYPLVTVIGDSFLEGSGAEVGDMTSIIIARALGFNCALAAVGATGIINPGNRNTSGFPQTPFYEANRLTDLTLSGVTSAHAGTGTNPGLGLLFGSVNDQGLAPAVFSPFGATLQAAINNRLQVIVDAWVTARPGKPLVLMGPIWPSGLPSNLPPLDIYRIRDGMAEAAWSRAADNVWFIDRLQQLRREGIYTNPNDQAALYTGGLTGTDATHPTPAGHRHDGLADATQLRRLILTEFG